MIVPKKPFWMRKVTYLRHIADTFIDQVPDIVLKTYPPAIALFQLTLYFNLTMAYPDRNKLQEIIDKYSEIVLKAQRGLEEKLRSIEEKEAAA